MKRELKHIAPYSAYKLKLYWHDGEFIEMYSGNIDKVCTPVPPNEKRHSPIFRPLLDLIDEIEVNGEKFVPLEKLAEFFHRSTYNVTGFKFYGVHTEFFMVKCFVDGSESRYKYFQLYIDILRNEYRIVEKLFEWHFDVFGLIAAGLAVDMNTIEKAKEGPKETNS